MAPHADVLYACDARWWNHHGEDVCRSFGGERWTHQNADTPDGDQIAAAKRWKLNMMPGRSNPGLGRDVMHFGDNSGYQAINLAYLWGAGRIILLGYDMQRTGGRAHFFGDHPGKLNSGTDYTGFAPNFRQLAADLRAEGVEVINCTRETALNCFPRAALADVL